MNIRNAYVSHEKHYFMHSLAKEKAYIMKKTNEVENLTYTIEGKKVAEILGVQNFTTKEAAILELVKNAYDAGSKNLTIHFEADSLFIKDDGEGMTNQDIKRILDAHWEKYKKLLCR